MTKIAALDLSLTCSGITRIQITPLGAEVTVTRVESKAPKPEHVTTASRSQRLRKIGAQVFNTVNGADLVLIEGPSFASSGAGTWDRSGLWWLVVARLTGTGHNVVEIPPSNLKTYALGRGSGAGTGKDDVLTVAVRRYPHVQFSGNDEADSLIMAAMGARWIGHPIEGDLPQSHLRGMNAVKWQPTTR